MSPRRWAVPAAWGALIALAACEQAPAEAPFDYPVFTVTRLVPAGWMVGTRVEIEAEGILPPPVASYSLELTVDGQRLDFPLEVAAGGLAVEVGADWLPTVEPSLEGEPAVATVHRQVGELDAASAPLAVSLDDWPDPRLVSITQDGPVYPGDVVAMRAEDLFRPEEEMTNVLMVRGSRGFDAGARAPWIQTWGDSSPLVVAGETGREASSVRVCPDLVGLRPGAFDGIAYIYIRDPREFEGFGSDPVDYAVRILPPVLDSVGPSTTSRGRVLVADGRGLLPLDPVAETASVLLFDGVFTPRRGAAERHTGVDAWAVPVEVVDGNTGGWAPLRTQPGEDGGLVGLGARAGRFEGTVRLRVAAGADAVASDALPIALDVTSPRQEVELRVLPGFDDALALFGLEAERAAVLARILAVVERDYAGLDIGFAYAPPAGFAEWSVVELAGEDPNGGKLLGLDATTGKDVGNLRLDDVVGGFDPETRARGLAAYGGVFASELLHLSPSVATNVLASPRFDDVFAPVVPALGGIPAAPGESDRDDARGAAIREAARVFANLVGSTITHEVGHTLGLVAIDGRVHNEGDNPGWIMDAGIYRPFEERAELDGAGPAVFSPDNRAYLEQILALE